MRRKTGPGLYRSRLAGRRVLVLLDNARDGDQVRPLLPGDPGCPAVVTSRDALAGLVATDGARRLDLDVLPVADAVALLRSLIGGRAGADPEAAVALAGLCARLPLALRIAAEMAAARPSVPLAELVAELAADRLGFLDAGEDRARGAGGVLLVAAAAAGRGGAGVCAAGAAPGSGCGCSRGGGADRHHGGAGTPAAVRLHRASLVQLSGPGRYGMHDLLRDYAGELAAADLGRCQQGLTGLFDYYLAAAAAAMDVLLPAEASRRPLVPRSADPVPVPPGQAGARAWLDRERANLTATVVHCAGHGWPGHATDLAGVLHRYLMRGSYLPEGLSIYSHALLAAGQSGDLAAEAGALNGLGAISYMKGRFPDADGHYQAALALYRRSGQLVGQARVLRNLGQIEHQLHNDRSAAGYYRQAITAFTDADDNLGAALALADLAEAETELGCYDQAAEHLQHALPVVRAAKDQESEGAVLEKIGGLSLRRGQLSQAAAFFEQALAIFRRLDYPTEVAAQLFNLGAVSLRQADYRQAIGYLRQALTVFRQPATPTARSGRYAAWPRPCTGRSLPRRAPSWPRRCAWRPRPATPTSRQARTATSPTATTAPGERAGPSPLAAGTHPVHQPRRTGAGQFGHCCALEEEQLTRRLAGQWRC